jgi:Fic family protein
MTHASRATAQREIANMVRQGLLVRRPAGGRSTSYDAAWG